MAEVDIVTFGYGHGKGVPPADITLDLRDLFRDPHVDPELREMTGEDDAVIASVLAMPGFTEYIEAASRWPSAAPAVGIGRWWQATSSATWRRPRTGPPTSSTATSARGC